MVKEIQKEVELVDNDTISIPKKKLEQLMDRLDRLEYASSKANLATYDSRNKESLGTTAWANVYEGKIITAWEMVENIVERNPLTGVWHEKQTIRLHFLETEETIDIPYVQFIRRLTRKEVTRKSKTETENGNEVWKVTTIETGLTEPKEFLIDIRFIN